MELTDNGFYKTPRIIKGMAFLEHIQSTYNSGNAIYVQFWTNKDEERVLSYTRLYDTGTDNAVLFQISEYPLEEVLIRNLEEYEFVQYRPQTAWKAIHMGSTKRINLEQFEEIWISDTFRHLTPVLVSHGGRFWNVMGLELTDTDDDAVWYLYLKRTDDSFMTRVEMPRTQKFIYHGPTNSWSLDNPTEEITDHEEIKQALKSVHVYEVTVSGVSMKMIRVMHIAANVLFFVFKDEKDVHRYYYARPGTKLRIVTDAETLEKKYLLDHVKAIHVD